MIQPRTGQMNTEETIVALPETARLGPGDQVQWSNHSYLVDSVGQGVIVHAAGPHAVIFNPEIARTYPHISPYVLKRVDELRPADLARAA